MLAKQAVEVAECVEAAIVAYLADAVGGVDELAGSHAKAHFNHIVAESLACTKLEEPAERCGRHAYEVGKVGKADFFGEMIAYVVLHLEYATAVAVDVYLCKRRRGKLARIAGKRQLVEYCQSCRSRRRTVS